MTRTTIRLWLTVVLGCCGVASACSNDEKSTAKPTNEPTTDKPEPEGPPPKPEIYSDSRPFDGIDSYQNVQGGSFLVKNDLQLRAAADTCLGAGLGVITDDMFAAARCAPGQGGATGDKLVILGADKCPHRGRHIYEVLRDQLWSPTLGGRTDTLAAKLTPAYLQALAQAADVYAHGVADPAALCDTDAKSAALLAKCLPQFGASDLGAVAADIAALCRQGGVKSREALATVLGSAAFATSVAPEGERSEP